MARAGLTPADPASLLAALDGAADEAAAAGFEDHHYRVAGFPVRLRFAGAALVPHVTGALEHLRIPPAPDPALTIRIWEGDVVPDPVRGHFDEGFFQSSEGSTTALHGNEGYLCAEGPGRVDRAAPISPILRSWLAPRGIQLVHAAGVGTPEGCVLLVGTGGAGKSTAAAACAAAGLGCVGDDTCLIGEGEPPSVLSVYRSAIPDEALLLEAPLRSVAVVRLSGSGHTRVRPASATEVLTAAAPTSVLRMPGPAQATLSRLATVIEKVDRHHLEIGTEGVADAVRSLL